MYIFFVEKSKLFNYADENTVAFTHGVFETLINTQQSDSISLINWFTVNKWSIPNCPFMLVHVGHKNVQPLLLLGQEKLRFWSIDF